MKTWDRSQQETIVECDECGESTVSEYRKYREVNDDIHADGWRCFQDSSGDWKDACPDCVANFAANND